MSILTAIFDSNKVFGFEQAFGAKDITTPEMKGAIRDWYGLYYGGATEQEDPCQRIPNAIVSKLYKAVFSEYEAGPAQHGGKGAFLGELLAGLDVVRKTAVQQMLIGGRCFLKPLLGKPMTFGVVSRQNYMPLGVDAHGNITDVGTSEQTRIGNTVYTLLERRTVDAAGYLTIESRLFRADNSDSLGVEVPLAALDKYAALEPVLRLPQPVFSTGLIPLSCPAENCVDGSADAVSVYAAAVGLLHNINRNEAQLNGEFENGRSRIIASADLLRKDAKGRRTLSDTLFTAIDDDPEAVGITIFSPALREQSYLARKTEYLRNVESLIGLKRGLLSDVEAAEKTATEITSSAGEYNLTIIDFQQAWERAVREAVRVCCIIGEAYHLYGGEAVDPEAEVVISWGNGVLYDENQVWTDYKAMVSAGLIRPEYAIGWYFDLPTETPADLEAIRAKYMPGEQDAAAEDSGA